jgi:hypothetical protein
MWLPMFVKRLNRGRRDMQKKAGPQAHAEEIL